MKSTFSATHYQELITYFGGMNRALFHPEWENQALETQRASELSQLS
jgi:hypothetical protein